MYHVKCMGILVLIGYVVIEDLNLCEEKNDSCPLCCHVLWTFLIRSYFTVFRSYLCTLAFLTYLFLVSNYKCWNAISQISEIKSPHWRRKVLTLLNFDPCLILVTEKLTDLSPEAADIKGVSLERIWNILSGYSLKIDGPQLLILNGPKWLCTVPLASSLFLRQLQQHNTPTNWMERETGITTVWLWTAVPVETCNSVLQSHLQLIFELWIPINLNLKLEDA